MITSVDGQTGIRLERNKDWNPATDDVRTALPDAIVVRTGLSGIERDQALLAGSADVDLTGAGVQPATTARLSQDDDADPPLTDRVDDVTTGAVRLLALPTDVAPFDNADCRAAVAQVIDRRSVQQAQGGAVAAVRSSVLWPRGLPGGPKDPDPSPDLDAARKSLTACGQPDGFSTVLAVADAPSSVSVAHEVAGELARIGIEVDVQALDPTTFYAKDVGNPDNVKASGYGIILATWTADFPTPASFLVPLVDGRSIRTVGNTNYARLNDADINGLVDTARAAAAGDAALQAWGGVATAAGKSAAYVPLSENRIQLIAGQRLRNGLVMQPYGGYDLATAGIR
jgi:peptide/nickel transport system substrate-binding protein